VLRATERTSRKNFFITVSFMGPYWAKLYSIAQI